MRGSSGVQTQTAVTAHFSSEQLLLFVFAPQILSANHVLPGESPWRLWIGREGDRFLGILGRPWLRRATEVKLPLTRA